MSTSARTIVLASRNADKLRELRQLCEGLPFEVASATDYVGLPEVLENGTSARGNAARKALVAAGWTGEIAVADDTTFQVRQLGGLPDVFASRFAGDGATYEDNARLALELMEGVPDEARDVRFETCMVWVDPRPGVDREPGPVAPAEMRWVHDPFATRPTDPDVGTGAAAARHKEWSDYLAWFGTLPVSWGADVERTCARVAELVAPHLEHTDPPAGVVQIDDVQLFTADGPRDRRAPAWRIALPEGAPGRRQCEPVWFELSCEGRLLGTLTHQPLGQNGFGYDPIVMPQGTDRTLAELSDEEKNAISHRGRALRRLLQVAGRVHGVPRGSVSTG